jgi:cell division protein FtsB
MSPQRKWLYVVMGFVIAYFAIVGNRGLWNLYKLHQEKHNLSEQIVQLKSEINGYQTEYKVFEKSTLAVEKQAREDLNLVKPGEMVYKFSKIEIR